MEFSSSWRLRQLFCFQNTAVASDYSTPLVGIKVEDKLDFHIGEGVFQKFSGTSTLIDDR